MSSSLSPPYLQDVKPVSSASLRKLWQLPPLAPCPAPETLELPLLPSSRLRVAGRLLLVLVVLYALELWLTGHPCAALLILLIAGASAIRRNPRDRPCCLVLKEDGRLFLHGLRGAADEMQLRRTSLRLGAHLLLVLRGNRRTVRLLLGPGQPAAAPAGCPASGGCRDGRCRGLRYTRSPAAGSITRSTLNCFSFNPLSASRANFSPLPGSMLLACRATARRGSPGCADEPGYR